MSFLNFRPEWLKRAKPLILGHMAAYDPGGCMGPSPCVGMGLEDDATLALSP